MKVQHICTLTTLLLFGETNVVLAQGTAFGYQGRFNDSGQAANGTYDFRFTIYDSANLPGTLIAGPVTNSTTGVTNGLFSATLDFGAGVFTGPPRWLEIAARTNGAGSFITLSPRQQLTAAPYAIMANATSNLLGSLPAVQLSGIVPSSDLGGTYSGQLTLNNPLNHLCGDGSCLTGVNASLLDGLGAANFWQLSGNAGTTPAVNFLGTSDSNSLVFKVNDSIAIRIDPSPYAPNIVAGLAAIKPTVIFSNVTGAVVAGGGAPSPPVSGNGGGDFFAVYDNDGTIGGGFGNRVGTDNNDATDAPFATVAGGVFNWAAAYGATVAGGDANFASGGHSAILGGYANQAGGNLSAIGGGYNNAISTNASFSIIAGGQQNSIGDIYSFIGGGTNNAISPGAPYSVVGGGSGNGAAAVYTTIAGGIGNLIQGGAYDSTIGGGVANSIGLSMEGSTIAGGYNNTIENDTGIGFIDATIGGGLWNTIGGSAGLATIGGGESNTNLASHGTISGGSGGNIRAGADFATIPGGYFNVAAGAVSFAAGNEAQALHQGAFVWADSQSAVFASTANDQVNFRCEGGARFLSNPGATVGVQLLPSGNAWSSISDRNAKKNFQAVDTLAVLEKLVGVPVQRWNYKWEEDSAVPHLGPMAQDFKGAFFPGRDDKSISTMEFDGVELAAIQGLNQKLEEHEAELKRQLDSQTEQLRAKEAALQSVEQRLQRLEALLAERPNPH